MMAMWGQQAMEIIFMGSVATLIYVYMGYGLLLRTLVFFAGKESPDTGNDGQGGSLPLMSIIISAHNEEGRIAERIRNLLEQDYPAEALEILVASDGSTDGTAHIVRGFGLDSVRVLDFAQNRGRAMVQNDGVREARGDILVFTDAETEFEPDFLRVIAGRFANPATGCVVGNLVYRTSGSAISESEGFYWRNEKRLRGYESRLGLLATATGACMGVRANLWRELEPIDDCDYTTPLDVILSGSKVVYAPEAVAYDTPAGSVEGELRTRIRQASKNFIGTLRRWGPGGWLRHPLISWGLVSHKILRWFTLYFMLAALVANMAIVGHGLIFQVLLVMQATFYLTAAVGYMGHMSGRRVRLASTIFSFCVASLGMGIGVIKGLMGRAPAAYRS